MFVADYLIAGIVAVVAGLDRTAAFQFLVSRPIVAGPLTGVLLGDAMVGLQVGFMVELLWLCRLPVGTSIPPDDTQVAVGGTALAVTMGSFMELAGLPFTILCTLIAMPLGKIGQYFDYWARRWNDSLIPKAQVAIDAGKFVAAENIHLRGIYHFAAASLATFFIVVSFGSVALYLLAPFIISPVADAANWMKLAFPLIGTSVILGTMKISRSLTIFSVSFVTVLLALWLL